MITRNTLFLVCLLVCIQSFSRQPSLPLYGVSDSAEYFFKKGLEEKKAGRRMESVKNFEKSLKFNDANKEVYAELAAAYYEMRQYFPAINNYKKLVELGDTSPNTFKQLLQLSFNFKNYNDVRLYADKLKKADPSEKVNYYLGKASYEEENYGDAIKYLGLAAKEDETNAEVQYLLARSYADMMNYKPALPYFQKAIELDSAKSNWIYEMSLIYYAAHDDKNALKYMLLAGERGLKKDNDYMENLGQAYLNVNQVEQGIAVLEELLKRKPADLNLLDMIAAAYYKKGKYQEAIDYWDRILEYDKTQAAALYMIGMSYQKKGDKAKGTQLCDKAIQMDPKLSSLKQQKMMDMGL